MKSYITYPSKQQTKKVLVFNRHLPDPPLAKPTHRKWRRSPKRLTKGSSTAAKLGAKIPTCPPPLKRSSFEFDIDGWVQILKKILEEVKVVAVLHVVESFKFEICKESGCNIKMPFLGLAWIQVSLTLTQRLFGGVVRIFKIQIVPSRVKRSCSC